MTHVTFAPKFKQFEVNGPGEELIRIRHHFVLPSLPGHMGTPIYQKAPWTIIRKDGSWIYVGTVSTPQGLVTYQIAVINDAHTNARIYSCPQYEQVYRQGGLNSLTLFPTDQILLARSLADRPACYLHSGAVVLNGRGLVFVGHSESGKSTMVKMLQDRAKILCDERNIIRQYAGGFRVHGSWSHGEVPAVSANSAPLSAIYFLHKSNRTRAVSQNDQRTIVANLLACVVRPLVAGDWWNKILTLIGAIAGETPCYDLEFDTSGDVVRLLEDHQPSGTSIVHGPAK